MVIPLRQRAFGIPLSGKIHAEQKTDRAAFAALDGFLTIHVVAIPKSSQLLQMIYLYRKDTHMTQYV